MSNQVGVIKRISSYGMPAASLRSSNKEPLDDGWSLTDQPKRPGCGDIPSLHRGLVEPQPCLTTGSA